jgi:hypothetical protein
MMQAVVFDPAIDTTNLGDEVISSAVARLLDDRVDVVETISTHRKPSAKQRKQLAACDVAVVAGTNILSATRSGARYWPLSRRDRALMAGKTLLIGVGWWQYQALRLG